MTVEQRRAQRRGRVLGGVLPTSEDHRATTFELFFDLFYVFALTQVTGYMAEKHSGHGVLQGLLLLTLLWWTWSSYTWLGNQARADEGLLRAGMVVAMAAMFVVALTIPEAWRDKPGGLNGPLVLVGAGTCPRRPAGRHGQWPSRLRRDHRRLLGTASRDGQD
jgi:low temperature requirement protein LtrA